MQKKKIPYFVLCFIVFELQICNNGFEWSVFIDFTSLATVRKEKGISKPGWKIVDVTLMPYC